MGQMEEERAQLTIWSSLVTTYSALGDTLDTGDRPSKLAPSCCGERLENMPKTPPAAPTVTSPATLPSPTRSCVTLAKDRDCATCRQDRT
jgi:hypothetical protein